jgi:hypothetical protein
LEEEEEADVAVVRDFVFADRLPDRPQRVVEPELDMNRERSQQWTAVNALRELLRWLLPGADKAVRPPMRSVAREIEEAWPSGDR